MNDMPKHPCLHRRSGSPNWYFRKKIPQDLQEAHGGKTEIFFSLKTADYAKAKALVNMEAVKCDQRFEELRRQQARAQEALQTAQAKTELSDLEIERLALIFSSHVLAEDEQARTEGSSEEVYRSVAADLLAKDLSVEPVPLTEGQDEQDQDGTGSDETAQSEAEAQAPSSARDGQDLPDVAHAPHEPGTVEDETSQGVMALFPVMDDWSRRQGVSDREDEKLGGDLNVLLAAAKEALARNNITHIEALQGDVLGSWIVGIDKDSDSYLRLSRRILRAWKDTLEVMVARYVGQFVPTPPAPETPYFANAPLAPAPGGVLNAKPGKVHALNPLLSGVQQGAMLDMTQAMQQEAADNSPLFSEVFAKYLAERQLPKKTEADFKRYVERFISLHGDMPVVLVNKQHMREFKDAMLQYPSRLPTKLRKLSVAKVLKLTGEEGQKKYQSLPKLSPKTVNEKCLAVVNVVLSYASSNGYIENNPAKDIRAINRNKHVTSSTTSKERLPYDVDDLHTIFSSPVFTQGERPRGGGGEAAKWLPLLALFTGARLEELGQLRVEDVKQDKVTGIHYLDISAEHEGQSLKTASAIRKIPIHNELVALGFLAYVTELREAGDTLLFPRLRSKQFDKRTASWSQWWGRYARRIGITDKRKVFHSFRHTVKDAFREAGIEKGLYDAIQGHAGRDVSDSYGLGYSLRRLHEGMNAIVYEGLDLNHLKQKE